MVATSLRIVTSWGDSGGSDKYRKRRRREEPDVGSCREEVTQELYGHLAADVRAVSDAGASLDVISANFGRYDCTGFTGRLLRTSAKQTT